MTTNELSCPSCGSTDAARAGKQDQEIVEFSCDSCGHSWTPVPRQPCTSCGSADLDSSGYQGWSLEETDLELRDAPVNWHYIDHTTITCRTCHHDWRASA